MPTTSASTRPAASPRGVVTSVSRRQVGRGLGRNQHGQRTHQVAKLWRTGADVAQHREFVPHDGMSRHVNRVHCFLPEPHTRREARLHAKAREADGSQA